ncbi:MAG: YlcI/YnfO family protein [Clostridia bacterium]
MKVLRKFKIPAIPQTTSKSVRMPNNIIDDIEKAIEGKECSFSAFVIEACRVALDNIDE